MPVPPTATTGVQQPMGAGGGASGERWRPASADRWIVGVHDGIPLARVVGRTEASRSSGGGTPSVDDPASALRSSLHRAGASLEVGVPTHVRITASELASPALVRCVEQAVTSSQARQLVLELMADEPIGPSADLTANLRDLRSAGTTLAVRGFGAGFANFQVLALVQPDAVGIALEIARMPAIAPWFLDACDRMGATRPFVTGVETAADRSWAAGAGFDAGTGGFWMAGEGRQHVMGSTAGS